MRPFIHNISNMIEHVSISTVPSMNSAETISWSAVSTFGRAKYLLLKLLQFQYNLAT